MIKAHLLTASISTLFFLTSIAQGEISKSAVKNITKDVKTLSSDKMEGRETGSPGEAMAAEYIAGRMKKIGLLPYGVGGYYQKFTFTPKAHPHAKEADPNAKPITGKNVVGFIDNGAPNTVVIGGHYDHLGFGGEGSRHVGEPAIHNGADDNASGVAAMLKLAELLSSSALKRNNYLFIAFSGEEKGLWGSKSYMKNPTVPAAQMNYMINMDMVGRLDSNKLAVNGVGTSSQWKPTLEKANKRNLNLVLGEAGIGPSDHTSFYLEEIPVLHFFTGQHGDYHKPSDDFDLVNIEGVYIVSELIFNVITELDSKEKLDYKKTKSEGSKKAPKFKVTLGVMPDYMFQGDGMRVDGVIPERPAANAGIKKGDVVTKMGEVEIKDMQSYMKGLAQFKPGDKTDIIIIRDGNEQTISVQF